MIPKHGQKGRSSELLQERMYSKDGFSVLSPPLLRLMGRTGGLRVLRGEFPPCRVFLVMKTFKIYSQNNFLRCSRVLTVVSVL